MQELFMSIRLIHFYTDMKQTFGAVTPVRVAGLVTSF